MNRKFLTIFFCFFAAISCAQNGPSPADVRAIFARINGSSSEPFNALKYQLNGFDALTAVGTNMFAGGCGNDTVTGAHNMGFGMPNPAAPQYRSLGSLTNGSGNLAMGFYSLLNLTSGSYNLAAGLSSAQGMTVGNFNIALGYESSFSVNGDGNISAGIQALKNGAAANYTVAIGGYAAMSTAVGNLGTVTNGVFIGKSTKALEDDSTNEIVIGFDAIGAGDNSVTLGSDSVVLTKLKGKVDARATTGALIFGDVTLADDATVDIKTLLGLTGNPTGRFQIYLNGNDCYLDCYIQGGTNDVSALTNRFGAATDTDGSLCVFSAGSEAYTLKNRLGAEASFTYVYMGRR